MSSSATPLPHHSIYTFIKKILSPEKNFFRLAIIYGIGVSLFSLTVPISVQMLINTIANTALVEPLIILAGALFVLLLLSGLLNALRIHLMEIFSRRFYARMVSEITLRTIYAQNPFFSDQGKSPLFNRYFDIVIIQKTVPHLLIGGFAIILHAIVGFIVVSMYHPLFLVFSIGVILALALVWLLWGKGAVKSAIELSHQKHSAAGWLEGLGASNGYFKSKENIESALKSADEATSAYINASRRHFRYSFSQTIAFLFIYASASALLLGMGGWLVIQSELSLGQLVAAELILSVVFYGISQLGVYLISFYDLCAAIDELSQFYDITQEIPAGVELPPHTPSRLIFDKVKGKARGEDVLINLDIPPGSRIAAKTNNHGIQRFIANLLKHHEKPNAGIVSFAGKDILDIEVHELRQRITILDRSSIVETTIRDHLKRSQRAGSDTDMIQMLEIVELKEAVLQLEEGMDTKLATTGYPMSTTEILKLKLAGALIAQPDISVLTQLYDMIPEKILSNVLDILQENQITVIYFTNREDLTMCDQCLNFSSQIQQIESIKPGVNASTLTRILDNEEA